MAQTITFDENKNQIKVRLYKADEKQRAVVERYMIKKAKDIEKYMKANHPWKNRTGAAEKGLSAKLTTSKKKYANTIALSHGVPYGVYLEYSMERRFAIIEPTIRIKGPEFVNDLQGKLNMFFNVKEV